MNIRLTRSIVKQNIQDGDRVHVAMKTYNPETSDHQLSWSKIAAAVEKSGDRGAVYSTLRAISGSNKDYAAYLIGQVQVLRCRSLEQRLGLNDNND